MTILHDALHPSWIQWPHIELPADQPSIALGVENAPAGCKVPGGFPCVPPSQLDLEF